MVPSFDRVRRTFAAEDLNIKGLIRTRLARSISNRTDWLSGSFRKSARWPHPKTTGSPPPEPPPSSGLFTASRVTRRGVHRAQLPHVIKEPTPVCLLEPRPKIRPPRASWTQGRRHRQPRRIPSAVSIHTAEFLGLHGGGVPHFAMGGPHGGSGPHGTPLRLGVRSRHGRRAPAQRRFTVGGSGKSVARCHRTVLAYWKFESISLQRRVMETIGSSATTTRNGLWRSSTTECRRRYARRHCRPVRLKEDLLYLACVPC